MFAASRQQISDLRFAFAEAGQWQVRSLAGEIVPARWRHWLTLVAAGVAALGVVLVLWPGSGVFNLVVFYSLSMPAGFSAEAVAYVEFVYGVLGAVLIGWMAMVIALVHGPFRRGEPIAWTMLAASMSIWFVVDSGFSLAMGFWQNAVLNLVVFGLFAVPLVATRQYFHR